MVHTFIVAGLILSYLSLQSVFDYRPTRDIVIDTNKRLKAHTCDPILITQAGIGTTGFTITNPGVYVLAENIMFAPILPMRAAITIESDDVQLDLQCFSIEQTNMQAQVHGIQVSSDHGNILISNGHIMHCTGDGIHVDGNTMFVYCDSVKTLGCSRGIVFGGTTLTPIHDIQLISCDVILSATAYGLYEVTGGQIRNCLAQESRVVGFDMLSEGIKGINNFILNTINPIGDTYGINIQGSNNTFYNTYIEMVQTLTGIQSNQVTAGFSLNANVEGIVIEKSKISDIRNDVIGSAIGILMKYNPPALSTTDLPNFFNGFSVNSVQWTASGRYIALGAQLGNVKILEFQNDAPFTLAAQFNHSAAVSGVSWSPDNKYLVIGGAAVGQEVQVLEFNGSALANQAVFDRQGEIFSVDWSPRGRFIAAGGQEDGGLPAIDVLLFTGTSLDLIDTFTHDGDVFSVDWSPDSQYLAASGQTNGNGVEVQVFEFDGQSLVEKATFSHGATIVSVQWSPDGRFLAIAGAANLSNMYVQVLEFTGNSLNSVATFDNTVGVNSINWSPDGNYLVLGSDGVGGQVRVLQFDGSALTVVTTFNHGASVLDVNWAFDGAQIIIGGNNSASIDVRTLSGFEFPRKCIIRNNQVWNVQGPARLSTVPGVSTGRGIVASSNRNVVIQNTAFDTDLTFIFVHNVYEQFLVNVQNINPSLIDNLSFPPL